MLAQLQKRLPIGEHWRYEPKLDGFRGLLWRRGDAVQLLSRNLKDLKPWFPALGKLCAEHAAGRRDHSG
jgi:ATP-dependent DNA ligase